MLSTARCCPSGEGAKRFRLSRGISASKSGRSKRRPASASNSSTARDCPRAGRRERLGTSRKELEDMKAVVFHSIGDIRLDDVEEPKIQEPTDAIVRLTSSAICGTDLHMIRGTMAGMSEGTILGHEGVGVVEEVGPQVRNLQEGDRVVIPSTIERVMNLGENRIEMRI